MNAFEVPLHIHTYTVGGLENGLGRIWMLKLYSSLIKDFSIPKSYSEFRFIESLSHLLYL